MLAKLDGTAKGGVVLAIKEQLNIPVKFIGLGETPQDIETFDPKRFVDALFGEIERVSYRWPPMKREEELATDEHRCSQIRTAQ